MKAPHTPHLASCVWQAQHVALSEISVWAHDDHVHHQWQAAKEALKTVSIRCLRKTNML
jgi:hypothetical protein